MFFPTEKWCNPKNDSVMAKHDLEHNKYSFAEKHDFKKGPCGSVQPRAKDSNKNKINIKRKREAKKWKANKPRTNTKTHAIKKDITHKLKAKESLKLTSASRYREEIENEVALLIISGNSNI